MKYLFAIAVVLISTAASAEIVMIPWHGDYKHNSSKTWSRDNLWDSGFSKNFLNGAPEEDGKVQKDGELVGETFLPQGTTGPIPFMIVLHGCTGLDHTTDVWARHVAQMLNDQGIGVLVLNSFWTRSVHMQTCGMPDFHWGRRRADDAYSALDYLIEHKLAKPDEVYLMGQSNGGLTTLVSMLREESDHKNRFAMGFPLAPNCIPLAIKNGDYVRPMIVFVGDQDDANPPQYCVEMFKKKRSNPMQLIVYTDANHGWMFEYPAPRLVHGWTDSHGVDHNWHLSSNHGAEIDMMKTIISAIKTKTIKQGVETR